ncbi:hypothetical protein BH23VER1_BH23VER1_03600 [soil metagenome]
MKTFPVLRSLAVLALLPTSGHAALTLGPLSDFQDGTLQGWSGNAAPTIVTSGGPAGAGDAFLQIGGGNRFAIFNADPNYSGALSSTVTAIDVDLMRPSNDPGSLEMRLVLFGPSTNDRWTSLNAQMVPNDGLWRTYTFSVLEPDLTRVLGSGTYAALAANVDRTMLRHDPDPASATGIFAPGTLGIDNVAAVPEPSAPGLILAAAAALAARRRRRRTTDRDPVCHPASRS